MIWEEEGASLTASREGRFALVLPALDEYLWVVEGPEPSRLQMGYSPTLGEALYWAEHYLKGRP